MVNTGNEPRQEPTSVQSHQNEAPKKRRTSSLNSSLIDEGELMDPEL